MMNQGRLQLEAGSHTPSVLNAGAQRAIWPCLNVGTWRRERSDRAIHRIF